MPRAAVPSAVPLALVALLLAACSESSTPGCATQIADEVCTTPAQLRGAPLVQTTAGSALAVALPPSALAEGRYVLVSLSYACPADAAALAPVQGVLELSGCVLRRTLLGEAAAPAVEVFELSYASEAILALQPRCDREDTGALQAAYGFDGERLELSLLPGALDDVPGSAPAVAATGPCARLETWELR